MQVSPEPEGGGDDGDDEAPIANQVASNSLNRSSSFLFDSLYDSSLLAGLSPHQALDQSDQSDEEQPAGQELPVLSAQERRRSELLANQEAEEQEAVQWGESSFNLSEWGDSLFVGEHFLERQSLLRHSERSLQELEAKSRDKALPEEHLSKSSPEPSHIPTQPHCIVSPSEHEKDKAETFANDEYGNQPNGNQGRIDKEGESGERVGKEKEVKMNVVLHNNAPESTFNCSPGLQEIFDRWPSMSDQLWENTTTGHKSSQTLTAHTAAANKVAAPHPPQSSAHVSRERGDVKTQSAAAESDSQPAQSPTHDTENVRERPGSAGDLIPPTQETPPVTPRVKLTTTSVQSPLTAQPLNQSTPSALPPGNSSTTKCCKSHSGHGKHLPESASSKQSNSMSDWNHKHQLKQSKLRPESELKSAPCSRSKPKEKRSPPASHTESPVTEGFTLELSQDASLCSSNSGTFSIIDVASDRHLFDTFVKEWKTKERYSVALACEKREREQQPEEEIGGKHKRGD